MLKTLEPKKQSLKPLLDELKEIKLYLKKFVLLIPEENLSDYHNASQIKKNYLNALKDYPPIGN